MKKVSPMIIVMILSLIGIEEVSAQGVYIGPHLGYSAQKPSLKEIDFSTDTTFLYGARAGIKIFMFALEINYFQAAHNLEPDDVISFEWGRREIDYNYLGLNLKYFFPILFLHPYVTAGYGYYTADISKIDKDTSRGFNLGLGVELQLGRKFSLLAEGKYHRATFDIDEKELSLGDFTFSGGFNFFF